jgi:hypothetical protein
MVLAISVVVCGAVACGSGESGAVRQAPLAVEAPANRDLPRQIESRVSSRLTERYGAAVDSVRCPDAIEVAVGTQLACAASLANGTALPIDVELTTAAGEYIAREKPVVLLGKLASVIAERYRARGELVDDVDCGGAIRVSEPGAAFVCTAAGAGGVPLEVRAEITSWQGRVELAYPDDEAAPSPGASMEANAAGSTTP